MRKSALSAFLLASVTTLLLAAGLVVREAETVAQGTLTLAVDADPTGNTARSVGIIDDCLSVEPGASFDIDIIIMNVNNLKGWQAIFVYDKSVLEVTDANVGLFQRADGRSSINEASDGVPDRDGRFFVAALQSSRGTDSGSGILAKLTLQTLETGSSPADLPQLDRNEDGSYSTSIEPPADLGPIISSLTYDEVEPLGDVNGDDFFDGPTLHARVAVGESCQAGPTPTPTPGPLPALTPTPPPALTPTPPPALTPTPPPALTPAPPPALTPTPPPALTPAPTSTPTPPPPLSDADGDGVPDDGDHCPGIAAGADVDASGCSEEQLQQLTEQVEQELLETLAAGLNLDVSLDTVTVGGSNVVLAVFADESDKPVSGKDVTFKIEQQPGSDATLDGESEITKTSDAEGFAEVTLNVGTTPGEIVVSATAEGQTETVTITVTVAAVEAAGGPASQGGQPPGPDPMSGPDSSVADGTPGSDPSPTAGNTARGSSDDDSGLPAWMVGVIVVAALALAAGVLTAWRAVRDRSV